MRRSGTLGDAHAQALPSIARLEPHARDVELSCGLEIRDREREAEQLIGYPVLAEMQSLVERVAGAGHVLGELGGAAFGIFHRRDQIAGAGFSDLNRLEAMGAKGGDERVNVVGFVTDVHPAKRLRGVGLRIDLDELAVVDLDEDLRGFSGGIGEAEGLLVAELLEEGDFFVEIAGAIGNVGDAGNLADLRGTASRSRRK